MYIYLCNIWGEKMNLQPAVKRRSKIIYTYLANTDAKSLTAILVK